MFRLGQSWSVEPAAFDPLQGRITASAIDKLVEKLNVTRLALTRRTG